MTEDPDVWTCPCDGCDFEVDVGDAAREQIEQHVRWIHARNVDFGENPMPALTEFMVNGIVRPVEYARLAQTIMQREFDAIMPHAIILDEVLCGVILAVGAVVSLAMVLEGEMAVWLGVVMVCATWTGFFYWLSRGGHDLRRIRAVRRQREAVKSGGGVGVDDDRRTV